MMKKLLLIFVLIAVFCFDILAQTNAVVRATRDKTFGTVTITDSLLVPDVAFGTIWEGSDRSVTANSLYDKFGTLIVDDSLWSSITLGRNGTASGTVNWIASDNDQGTTGINTSDAYEFTGFSGGITDGIFTVTAGVFTGVTSMTADSLIVTGGATFGDTVAFANDIQLYQTKKLILDGDADDGTYITESSADVFDGYAGGVNFLKATESTTISGVLYDAWDVTGSFTAGTIVSDATIQATTTFTTGANSGTSGQLNFIASDNDQGNININTSDQFVFTDFGGGVTDGTATLLSGAWSGATYNGLTVTASGNTFNLTQGSGSLDVAATKTINFDMDFTVDGTATTITGADQANTITLNESITIGGGNDGTLTYSVASKVLTVEDNVTVGLDVNALEGLSGTGLVTRTAANTYSERTITGTANEITVTNGDGVSGNPTIDLPNDVIISGTFKADSVNLTGGFAASDDSDVDGDFSAGTITSDAGVTGTQATFTGIAFNNNNTWFTGHNVSDASINIFKVTESNTLQFGLPVEISSLYIAADSGVVVLADQAVTPVSSSGDSLGFNLSIASEPIFKVRALSNGAGGINGKGIYVDGIGVYRGLISADGGLDMSNQNLTWTNGADIQNDDADTLEITETIVKINGALTAGTIASDGGVSGTTATFTGLLTRNGLRTIALKTTVADEGTYSLPDASNISGRVWVDGDNEYADFLVQSDGTVILIASNGDVLNTDTDGSLCIYDSGTQAIIKNRLGASKDLNIIYDY